MNLAAATEEMLRLSKLIDAGVAEMTNAGEHLAVAEHHYRKARAQAWHSARGENVSQREDWVNAHTADKRLARDRAENDRRAAIEAVRARQAQLSALQTLVRAHKAEAELAGYGPDA